MPNAAAHRPTPARRHTFLHLKQVATTTIYVDVAVTAVINIAASLLSGTAVLLACRLWPDLYLARSWLPIAGFLLYGRHVETVEGSLIDSLMLAVAAGRYWYGRS